MPMRLARTHVHVCHVTSFFRTFAAEILFRAKSHSAPVSKQKNRWFAGSWLSFSNFQVPFLSDEDFGPVEVIAIGVYFPLEHLDSRMFREKNFDRGSSTFELVHMVLINRMVLLGTHGLHCLFSLVMENSCSKQLGF